MGLFSLVSLFFFPWQLKHEDTDAVQIIHFPSRQNLAVYKILMIKLQSTHIPHSDCNMTAGAFIVGRTLLQIDYSDKMHKL